MAQFGFCSSCVNGSKVNASKKITIVYGTFEFPLTNRDVLVLKQSWPVVKQHWLAICAATFGSWFSLHPELRYLFKRFPQPEELSTEDLLKSSTIQIHIKKLESTIELLLSKVDDLNDFVKTLIEFGKLHHQLGAKQAYATSLAQSLLYGVTTSVACEKEVEYAWDSLFRFVMSCFKFGMRIENQKN